MIGQQGVLSFRVQDWGVLRWGKETWFVQEALFVQTAEAVMDSFDY